MSTLLLIQAIFGVTFVGCIVIPLLLREGVFTSLTVAAGIAFGYANIWGPIGVEEDAKAAVMAESPAAKFGVSVYLQCINPGPFTSQPPEYCMQMVSDLATKQHGKAFADGAIKAIGEVADKSNASIW